MNRAQRRREAKQGKQAEVKIFTGAEFKPGGVLLRFDRPVNNLRLTLDGACALAAELINQVNRVTEVAAVAAATTTKEEVES